MNDDDPVPATPVLEGQVLTVRDRRLANLKNFVKGEDPRRWKTGRRKGSKQKVGEAFVRDLMKWHAKHGMKAIEAVGKKKPEELLRIMASLVPKHDVVEVGHHIGSVPIIELQELERRAFDLLARIPDGRDKDTGEN